MVYQVNNQYPFRTHVPEITSSVLSKENLLQNILKYTGIETLPALSLSSKDTLKAVMSMTQKALNNIESTTSQYTRALKLGDNIILLTADARIERVRSETCTEDELLLFAEDPDSRVREFVASSTSMPEKGFGILASDPYSKVRLNVVANPATPMRYIQKLEYDPDMNVKLNAGRRLEWMDYG